MCGGGGGGGGGQDVPPSLSVRSGYGGSSGQCPMVDPLSYFSLQPVLHNWCNKDRGTCYPVCGMVHINEPLLLIEQTCNWSGCPRQPCAKTACSEWAR